MSISLIAIRIVLSQSSNKLSRTIDYTAPKYRNLDMASASESSTPDDPAVIDDEISDVRSESHRITPSGVDHRKFRQITIEHYTDDAVEEKKVDPQESPDTPQVEQQSQSQNALSTLAASSSNTTAQIPFCIGNHFVEVIEGILHLYKENKLTPLGEESERSDIVCMLSVSANKTIHDILQFTAPFNQDIQRVQIIRDSMPNQYMVLIKFHTQRGADEFYASLNGAAYNSIEPDVCHLAFVAKIEVVIDDDDRKDRKDRSEEKRSESPKSVHLPIFGFTELPTCPVCLERMDESVQGILTILCNHSFHGKCLDQWYDGSCPVCRYCQTPESIPDNRCFECGSQSTTQDTLWICLICGHIGCGRYVAGHAYSHYRDTQHTYAMQLGLNNRVWDYAGDNYVHRLLQNKDGEPVELKAKNNTSSAQQLQAASDEKIDSVQLEYTYLLTNQLETQRHFYEESLSHLEQQKQQQIEELISKNRYLSDDNKKLSQILDGVKRDKQQLEKKIGQLSAKLTKTMGSFGDEQELNRNLRQNQDEWQRKLREIEKAKEQREAEIAELREQLRDLMFFLEAKDKLQEVADVSREELEGGQVIVSAGTSGTGGASGGGSKSANKMKNRKDRK